MKQLVRELTKEGALLELLFVSREGPVGDVMSGGLPGHSDQEMMEFPVLEKERGEQSCHLGSQEDRLICLGDALRSSPEGKRSPGSLDILQEGSLKDTRVFSSLKGTVTDCPEKWWNHHPRRYLKDMQTYCLWTWFSGGLGIASGSQ